MSKSVTLGQAFVYQAPEIHAGLEPGERRDICQHCGGWISLGHAVGSDCRPDEQIGKTE